MTAVTADRLAEDPESASAMVARLDPASPADRRQALDAMEALIDTWLMPAVSLLRPTGADPDHRWFDLNTIAGDEVAGLTMALLERRFPSIQVPPDDQALAAALDDEGVDVPSPEQRVAFFRAWMAQRALYIVRDLLDVVGDDPGLDPGEARWELDRLRRLRDTPLPSLERQLFDIVLERRAGRG